MSPLTLHYIYDPLCGWCYGSSPLLRAAAEGDDWSLELHAGGMMAGSNRQQVTPALRQFVLKHDTRIAALSGQPFGEAYRERLLRNGDAVFDSEPPITAMLAAGSMGAQLAMLERIQKAHYVEGRRVSEEAVLLELAAEIGLDSGAFRETYAKSSGTATEQHIAGSRALLDRVNGAGFPTFAFERGGQFTLVDSSRFLGRVDQWRDALRSAAPAVETQPAG